jgi:translation elongation factor EF-Ts
MKFKDLEKLIAKTASQKNIDKAIITDDLSDILRIKYGISIMDKERDLIDEVKNKIITRLYNSEDQLINPDADLQKMYKLDLLENDYINFAMDELEHEGLVKVTKKNINLTKEGIMKFKEFYGEI